jgi:hypothetical protein
MRFANAAWIAVRKAHCTRSMANRIRNSGPNTAAALGTSAMKDNTPITWAARSKRAKRAKGARRGRVHRAERGQASRLALLG